ncbi:DUF418 domain-containing protein [Corynebacterium afermentans]|nr:DUF418 domain-containing protein [Corynebacterium afermentans]
MKEDQRLIVPDLARGMALIGIAMANTLQSWIVNGYSAADAPGWSIGGINPDSPLDAWTAVFTTMFVRVRGLPMFSTLLGIGFGMVAASLARKGYGPAESRRILLRRYAWLGAFGLAHMFLLFYNEIMFAYGLVGVGLAVVYRMASKSLRRIAYVILGCFAAFCASGALGAFYGYFDPHSTRDQLSTDLTTFGAYFSANAHSAVGYVQGIWFIVIELFALALIGMVWARERVLFDVHAHRRTLTTWTCIAAAVVLLVGVPWGLSINGVLPSELEPVFYMLNQGFGFLTGPGIIAALALATEHLHNRVPGWSRAFVALGRRSMSGYIGQSFLFLLLVIPAGLGLWQDAGLAGKLLAGTVVWLITLALAVALEAAGRRGPFEWLHRRLSYGPAGKIEQNEASR